MPDTSTELPEPVSAVAGPQLSAAVEAPAPAPEQPSEPRPPPEIAEELLDSDAVKVVRRLRRAGFTAYLVGGCVRDLLLNVRPKDFDVATSAHPHQVKETFRNCRLIGRRFRLAHVYFRGGKVVEVSTFRANPLDELAEQNQLPQDLLIRHDNVFGSAVEDARRRDFTVNGLFYDLDEGKVVDHVEGKADLKARLVRTIGNPDVRMREDPVRILRAIRFAAKCDLQFEAETLAAMKAHVQEIPRCAPPRVLEELLKLARSGAARRCFELLREVGALRVLLPPVAAVFEKDESALARQLQALDALDAHVRVDEVPSDTVLLATLLMPLPRAGAPHGPIPKAAGPQIPRPLQGPVEGEPEPGEEERPAEVAQAGSAEADDELDDELKALEAKLDADDDDEVDDGSDEGDEGEDDEGEAGEDEGPGESDAVPAAADEVAAAAPEAPVAPPVADAPAVGAEAAAVSTPPAGVPHAGAMLPGGRRGGEIPVFSVGASSVVPWSLPREVVPAELVLTEMVRTARLPRRIAERTRLVLQSQPYLAGDRRRRGLPPNEFIRQSIFPEALAIFELNAAATGKGHEQLLKWQQLFLGQPVSELLAEEPGGDRPRRRRRRRGGRGRRRS